jgi:diaminopimelate epimerase
VIRIPFAKLHGAENDFLLTWADEAPVGDLSEAARSVCARNTGVGADAWMLVSRIDFGLSIRLFNSDGSEAEISGNGTRCAAAFGLWTGAVKGECIRVETAAGLKVLRVLAWKDTGFRFEMDMGRPYYDRNEVRTELRFITGVFDATILNVGNPQCAIFVENLPADWRVTAALAEGDPRFAKRTNVSFVVIRDEHNIETVFFERGAGETRSSGTGSTGAAVAAIIRGKAKSPVIVHTPAGQLTVRWEESVYLTGPVEFVAEGVYFLSHV